MRLIEKFWLAVPFIIVGVMIWINKTSWFETIIYFLLGFFTTAYGYVRIKKANPYTESPK